MRFQIGEQGFIPLMRAALAGAFFCFTGRGGSGDGDSDRIAGNHKLRRRQPGRLASLHDAPGAGSPLLYDVHLTEHIGQVFLNHLADQPGLPAAHGFCSALKNGIKGRILPFELQLPHFFRAGYARGRPHAHIHPFLQSFGLDIVWSLGRSRHFHHAICKATACIFFHLFSSFCKVKKRAHPGRVRAMASNVSKN